MNAKRIGSQILGVLLGLVFLGAALAKFTAQPMMVAEFAAFGYPLWFMYVTATCELVGAIAVLIPRTSLAGAGLLGAVMIGAIFSHLTRALPGMVGAPIVLLILLAIFAALRRPAAVAGPAHS